MFDDQQTFGLQQTHRLPQGVVLTPSWRASFTWDRIAPAGISPLSSISRRRVYTSAVLLTTGLGKRLSTSIGVTQPTLQSSL